MLPAPASIAALKRGEIDVVKLAVGHADAVIVAPADRGAIADKMLGAGDDVFGRANIIALKALNLRARHRRAEIRIFAGAFDDASPAWIATNIHHGRKGPVNPQRARFPGRNGARLLHQSGIKTRGRGERHRKHRPHAPDHIIAQQ